MIIYGAGMSGLLAARMLKQHNPVVYEASPTLPNNHGALLRFRTDKLQRETGIKLKKVWVQKAVMCNGNGELTTSPSIQLQNMYSIKVTGEIKNRSIMNLEPGERYIAPEDFIWRLSEGVTILHGGKLDKESIEKIKKEKPTYPIISTIPMDSLMKLIGWSDVPAFKHKKIITINARITGLVCDVYQTIYVPFLSNTIYRMSVTGDNLIIEMMQDEIPNYPEETAYSCLHHFFGNTGADRLTLSSVTCKEQKYGKLTEISPRQRKEFILAMTDIYGIYSVGRFATWRQILMDDVVNDIKLVDEMIGERSGYARKLKYSI